MSEPRAEKRGGGFLRGLRSRALREDLAVLDDRLTQQAGRLDRLRGAMDMAVERLNLQKERLSRLSESQRTIQRDLKQIKATLGPVAARVEKHDEAVRQTDLREVDFRRAMQQLAALETRVGAIEEDGGAVVAAMPGDAAASLRLLDEVRREHEQVRVRFQLISSYEERLRRIESMLVELYDGDRRQPL